MQPLNKMSLDDLFETVSPIVMIIIIITIIIIIIIKRQFMARVTTRALYNVRCSYSKFKQLVGEVGTLEKMCLVVAEEMSSDRLLPLCLRTMAPFILLTHYLLT